MQHARAWIGWSLLALLAGGCGSTPHVTFDYDHDADFSSYRTYAWVEPEKLPADSLIRRNIVSEIDQQLAAKGLTKTDTNPDLHVLAVGGATDETVVDTDEYGYGYGPGWYYGGAPMNASTGIVRYTRGTLVVDLSDARTKKLVWRGTATDIMSQDPGVNTTKVLAGVDEMFKRYPPGKR